MSILKPAVGNGVLVLSYNVSFQAMDNSSTGSAGALGKKCTCVGGVKKPNCLTICAANMARMIDGIPGSLHKPSLDFVGLQEANRSDVLQKAAPATLATMTIITSQVQQMKMASFYDSSKYILIKHCFGNFNGERPFHILVFKNQFDSFGTIFINNHCPHHYPIATIQNELSNAVSTLNLSNAEKQYRIIAVGDYNETFMDRKNKKMKQYAWTPFIGAGISTKIEVKNFVLSCCQDDGEWDDGGNKLKNGSHDTDFVFDSASPAHIQIPPLYDCSKLQSDHLPVIAELI